MKEGIPIAKAFIIVICIGIKGEATFKINCIIASRKEKIVFTINKLADRSILFIVLLPSATTFGSEAKLESKESVKKHF